MKDILIIRDEGGWRWQSVTDICMSRYFDTIDEVVKNICAKTTLTLDERVYITTEIPKPEVRDRHRVNILH